MSGHSVSCPGLQPIHDVRLGADQTNPWVPWEGRGGIGEGECLPRRIARHVGPAHGLAPSGARKFPLEVIDREW